MSPDLFEFQFSRTYVSKAAVQSQTGPLHRIMLSTLVPEPLAGRTAVMRSGFLKRSKKLKIKKKKKNY